MAFSDMDARAWRDAGTMLDTAAGSVFVLDTGAIDDAAGPPLLVIHGFPSSSYDFHLVLDELAADRRVVLFDQLGFGWSDKPDRRYGIRLHADTAQAVLDHLGLTEIDLLTHDMGDTVGGELLARTDDAGSGTATEVRRRVLTNGSIYLELAQLTPGQLLLLDLPDERSELLGADAVADAMAATFSAAHPATAEEIREHAELVAHDDGHTLLPRTIRYLEDRRAEEARFTGAVQRHRAPLSVVWGVLDPVAVVAMTERLLDARPDAELHLLDGVGHYPMLESPQEFVTPIVEFLDR